MKPNVHLVEFLTQGLFSRSSARLLLSSLLALFVFGLAAVPREARAQAQAANGVIEGTVTDASGAVVPNAKVKIINLDTGLEREVTTTETGFFRVPLLPVGRYEITVTQTGFN